MTDRLENTTRRLRRGYSTKKKFTAAVSSFGVSSRFYREDGQ